MDRARDEITPEGLHNLVKLEFHILSISSSRWRMLREKQKYKASMELFPPSIDDLQLRKCQSQSRLLYV